MLWCENRLSFFCITTRSSQYDGFQSLSLAFMLANLISFLKGLTFVNPMLSCCVVGIKADFFLSFCYAIRYRIISYKRSCRAFTTALKTLIDHWQTSWPTKKMKSMFRYVDAENYLEDSEIINEWCEIVSCLDCVWAKFDQIDMGKQEGEDKDAENTMKRNLGMSM